MHFGGLKMDSKFLVIMGITIVIMAGATAVMLSMLS